MASKGAVALDKVIVNIESNVGNTHTNINKLAKSLETLKDSVKGGFNNLNKLATGLKELNKASGKLSQTAKNVDSISNISKALNSLGSVSDPKNFKAMVTSLEKLPTAFNNINPQSLENVKRVSSELAQSLSPLSDKLSSIGNGFTALSTLAKTYGVAVTKVGNDTKRATREMSSLSKAANVIKVVLKGAGATVVSTGNTIQRSFSKMNSKIKQVALSLLGTRTLFTMVRKAAAEYSAMDKTLADETTNLWRALGAQLAPAIEYVLYLFKQGVRVIYSIIKALTGIDLIARANARAMATFSKSTKDALGNLQKFDDLNVVEFDKGGAETPQIELDEIDLTPIQKVIDWMKKLKAEIEDAWKNGGWNDVAKVLAEGINGATNYIDPVALGTAIGNGIITGLSFIRTFIENIDWAKLGERISETIKNMDWAGIWEEIKKGAIAAFTGFTDFFDGLLGFDGAGNLVVTFGIIHNVLKGISDLKITGLFTNMLGDADSLYSKVTNIGEAFSLLSKNTLTTESISGITGVSKGVLNLMKPLSNVFGLITKGVSSLGLGPMVGIIAAIVVGIMALVKAFKNLYENSEPFRQTVDGLIASIKDYLLQCLDNLKTILTSLWEVLVVVWQQVIVPLFDLIVSIVEPILEAVVEIIAVLWEDVLKPLGEGLMAIVMPAFKIIVDVIKSLMPVIKAVIDILQWLWDQILEPIVKFLLDVVVNTIKIIASIVEVVIKAVVAYWENLIKIIGVGWGILKTGFLAIYHYIKDKVIDPLLKLWDKLKSGWNKMWDGIKSGAKSAINWVLGKVEDFINGIIKGINLLSSGFRKIGNKIFDIIGVDIKFEPLSTVKLPRLETGTNEVPYEGIYHLHPGEAVVPKKYNPALGNGGNDETNQKLDTLIGIMNNMNFTNVVNIGNKTLYKEQQRYNKMQNDKYGTTVNL